MASKSLAKAVIQSEGRRTYSKKATFHLKTNSFFNKIKCISCRVPDD